MNIKIIKNSLTELVITQQKKLTLTGSLFCLPLFLVLFDITEAPGLMLFFSCLFLWMIILFGFLKGVTYTVKANRTRQVMELSLKGILRNKNESLKYNGIDHILMAESSNFFDRSGNYKYHIIIETSDKRRIKLFGFKDRQLCKQTMALIESYL